MQLFYTKIRIVCTPILLKMMSGNIKRPQALNLKFSGHRADTPHTDCQVVGLPLYFKAL